MVMLVHDKDKLDPMLPIGEYMKEDRIRKGLTLGEYAASLGLPMPTIHKIILGTSKPTEITDAKIRRALGIPRVVVRESPAQPPKRGRGRPRKV